MQLKEGLNLGVDLNNHKRHGACKFNRGMALYRAEWRKKMCVARALNIVAKALLLFLLHQCQKGVFSVVNQ